MTDKLTRRGSIAAILLTGALLALGGAYAANPSVAAAHVSADRVGGDRPSGWAPASQLEYSGNAPSLTTNLEQSGGGGAQLWLGYALVGAGLLALTFGLAVGISRPRGGPGRPKDARPHLGHTAPDRQNASRFLAGR